MNKKENTNGHLIEQENNIKLIKPDTNQETVMENQIIEMKAEVAQVPSNEVSSDDIKTPCSSVEYVPIEVTKTEFSEFFNTANDEAIANKSRPLHFCKNIRSRIT